MLVNGPLETQRMGRRDWLKAGALAGLTLGFNASMPLVLRRQLLAAPLSAKKLIFIFQRGGNDSINTVIPRGDPEYNTENRPTLFIGQGRALDLGNGFAQLHPGLSAALEIYNSTTLNGQAGPGNLALLHRIGYDKQTLSHFDGQQFWENGAPTRPDLEEGMIFRQIAETLDPVNNPFAAAAIASRQLLSLRGAQPLLTLNDLPDYSFAGTSERVAKFVGRLPTLAGGPNGAGMRGLYGGIRPFPAKPYRDLVYNTGLIVTETVNIVQDALKQGPYVPENGADYSALGEFGTQLQTAAMLLKRTPVQILGIDINGWDTHISQGGVSGQHSSLLEKLGGGYQALFRDLQSQWDELVVVTKTEFGRTSKENAARGTDHAKACCMLVAGGSVKGGVYNCDATTWAPGDMFSINGRYLQHLTDFRAVFAEIFMRHFGDDSATLDRVIPGYSTEAAERPEEFQFLDFLPA